MGWVKLDDQFSRHPKVLRAGPLAGWLHVCALNYCAQYLTDGFIPKAAVNGLADFTGVGAEYFGPSSTDMTGVDLVPSLLNAGLWREVDGGYQIHAYLEYNPSRDDVTKKRAADLERKRNAERVVEDSGRNTSGVATDSTGPVPRPHPVPGPVSNPETESPSGAKAPSPQRGERRRVTIVDDAFKLEIENEFVGAFGSRGAVRDVIDEAMSHTARAKRSDQRAYLRNWVRRDAARVNPKAARRVAAESEIEERGVFSSKWSGCPVCGKANWDVSMGPICPTCVERGRAA